VYEQFLGKVIRLTQSHRAVVEDKPEVRKAGGVYYTPTYIVDYIVKQTVGKLVKGKKPGPRGSVSNIRILDPACGSGSFLLGAYQFLLDWHRDEYIKDGPEKWARGRTPRLYQTGSNEWKLTIEERQRILLNNIYGVDIDSQAVEVTKLSLLLKVLEGEDEQTIGRQLSLFHKRVLPDLANNIKCGNSLIGPDFYDGKQLARLPGLGRAQSGQGAQPGMSFLDEDEMYRVNAFDWNAEFPEIMKAGGFDAVISNPPWGAEFSEDLLGYLRRTNREIIVRMTDSFMYFVYQGCKILRNRGHFGMILPDVILYQKDNEKLRNFILKSFKINFLLNMGDVFEKVCRPASILICENSSSLANTIKISDLSGKKKIEKPTFIFDDIYFDNVKQINLLKIPELLFITSNPAEYRIWEKLTNVPYKPLVDIVDEDGIQRGVSPDLKKAFLVDSGTVKHYNLETTKLRRVLTGGKQVKRYFIDYPDLWLIYTTRIDNFKELPKICEYINQFKDEITCKEVKQNKHSLYSLHRPRKEGIFLKDSKLLGVITNDKIVVALDTNQTYVTDGIG